MQDIYNEIHSYELEKLYPNLKNAKVNQEL